MKQAEKTKDALKTCVGYCTNIFCGKYLDARGDGKVIFRIDYPKDDPDKKITVEMEREGKTTLHTLRPGDTYRLDHCVHITATRDITKNHIFPIVFSMDGQEYKLNRTKQNKLILTK